MGEEIGAVHTRKELEKMMELHVKYGQVDEDVGRTLAGALTYQDYTVESVMTPMEDTYMLPITEVLTFATVSAIFKEGHSRVPIYENDRNNVIGLLMVKDLIFLDTSDLTPLRAFFKLFGRPIIVLPADARLNVVLRQFKSGRGHMAVIAERGANNMTTVKGIVTLEDILEKILGDEILDESDIVKQVVTVGDMSIINREGLDTARLRLADSTAEGTSLSHEEAKIITSYLLDHVPIFQSLVVPGEEKEARAKVGLILENSVVLNLKASPEPLYHFGKKSTVCQTWLARHVKSALLLGVSNNLFSYLCSGT